MAIELVWLPPSDHWHLAAVAPFLKEALETGGGIRDWDLPDIESAAMAREVDIWALKRDGEVFGGAVSVLKAYARRKVWDILLMGTVHHRESDWAECLEQFKALARQVGAATITGTGRPGWARKLGATERRIFEIEV